MGTIRAGAWLRSNVNNGHNENRGGAERNAGHNPSWFHRRFLLVSRAGQSANG